MQITKGLFLEYKAQEQKLRDHLTNKHSIPYFSFPYDFGGWPYKLCTHILHCISDYDKNLLIIYNSTGVIDEISLEIGQSYYNAPTNTLYYLSGFKVEYKFSKEHFIMGINFKINDQVDFFPYTTDQDVQQKLYETIAKAYETSYENPNQKIIDLILAKQAHLASELHLTELKQRYGTV